MTATSIGRDARIMRIHKDSSGWRVSFACCLKSTWQKRFRCFCGFRLRFICLSPSSWVLQPGAFTVQLIQPVQWNPVFDVPHVLHFKRQKTCLRRCILGIFSGLAREENNPSDPKCVFSPSQVSVEAPWEDKKAVSAAATQAFSPVIRWSNFRNSSSSSFLRPSRIPTHSALLWLTAHKTKEMRFAVNHTRSSRKPFEIEDQ